MKYLFATLTSLFVMTSQASADSCDHNIPEEIQLPFERAVILRQASNYTGAKEILLELRAENPMIFCLQYELGRNQLNLEEYDAALSSFRQATTVATPEDHQKQAVFNIIGFTQLQMKRPQLAAWSFEQQKSNPQFEFLPEINKTKVFNNAGIAYLSLDQYEAAQENFKKAENMGSKLATLNLLVVSSLISVQEQGSKDIPGIFSVAIHSQPLLEGIEDIRANLATQLAVEETDLEIFKRANSRMHSITMGANLSYAKAQELQEQAKLAGVVSTEITATATWQNISYNKRLLKVTR